ncbi:deleted in malignant brain tumors 1 protein-like [Carcharodon carcharias]|uniref:deleted in malignant brain tumors 1 protein-like n=1 Tax=Carcharodon carcharias TaxID=13397 RepID=UPI001B7EA0A2|nr:deleted in malignant brain tumors 1 protein-like [Carcharodon carcharias]
MKGGFCLATILSQVESVLRGAAAMGRADSHQSDGRMNVRHQQLELSTNSKNKLKLCEHSWKAGDEKGGGWVLGSISPLMGWFILIGLFAGGSIAFSRDNIYRLLGSKSHPCTRVFKFLIADSAGFSEGRTGSSQADPSEAVKLRLANGSSRCAGRVEIHYRGKWGTVDDNSWDLQDSTVVCRELGCGTAVSAPGKAHFGEGSGPIVTYGVQCSGNEAALRECRSARWAHYSWSHSDDASAICSALYYWMKCGEFSKPAPKKSGHMDFAWSPSELIHQQCNTLLDFVAQGSNWNYETRLVGGGDQCSGRVEVLHGEQWGTLCDVHFALEDASVVCEQLQCGAVKEIPRNSPFGKGTGLVWKENYRCRGNESRLSECPVTSGENFNCSHGNDASVTCSAIGIEEGLEDYCHYLAISALTLVMLLEYISAIPDESWSLRLTNGGSRCDGRVEIYHNGRWGRVQDSLWDLNDANVVCRQLGCGVAIAAYTFTKYGESEGPVWVNDVQCGGNELHLRNCSSFAMNSSLNGSIGVGVLCSEHKQLRLSDGGSPCAGRVEIYYNGTWGSVCDDSWDLTDADVVCKQLHCGKALEVTLPASWGRGSGPVWLEGLNCSGEESFLWQCPSAYWGSHDCTHKEDVKIMCSEHKELRLVNGKHRCEGRVEVFYNGTWGTVCSEALDRHDAEVICKQFQCGPLVSIDYTTQSFGEGSGTIWLDEMECNFHESAIWQCRTDPWGQHNCNHREDAGVSCSVGKITKGQPHSEKDCSRESDSDAGLRLVGGNTNCSGRVEITCNNTWGTVCDDSWDMADANVVCRQLNCGSALLATVGAAFGQGEGDIWFDEVRCTGSESFLSDCPSSGSAQSDCDHKEDASVICSGHEDDITSIPLVIGITLGILLICEFIALIVLMQRQSSRKGSVTGGWGSPTAMSQAIYEEIQDIPPVKDPALTRGSVHLANVPEKLTLCNKHPGIATRTMNYFDLYSNGLNISAA